MSSIKRRASTGIDNKLLTLKITSIFLMALAFAIFPFFPPKLSLFEHSTLENSGQYGILHHYHD